MRKANSNFPLLLRHPDRGLGNDGPLKLLQSFTTRLLQSEHFRLREGGGRFLGNDGPLKLLQSFTNRLLQNEHFQLREGGVLFLGNDGPLK